VEVRSRDDDDRLCFFLDFFFLFFAARRPSASSSSFDWIPTVFAFPVGGRFDEELATTGLCSSFAVAGCPGEEFTCVEELFPGSEELPGKKGRRSLVDKSDIIGPVVAVSSGGCPDEELTCVDGFFSCSEELRPFVDNCDGI